MDPKNTGIPKKPNAPNTKHLEAPKGHPLKQLHVATNKNQEQSNGMFVIASKLHGPTWSLRPTKQGL